MSELRDDGHRFEMDEQGLTSWAEYRQIGDKLYIDHVETPPSLRGTGAAGRLMTALSEDIRHRGVRVIPICAYAAAWLGRSDEFRDLTQPRG
jgi:predicted GNAT family acetyltransferase